MAENVKREKIAENKTVAIKNDVKLCHRQGAGESDNVSGETSLKNGDWKKYGDLYVRCTYGKEDLTELLISYAVGLAALDY